MHWSCPVDKKGRALILSALLVAGASGAATPSATPPGKTAPASATPANPAPGAVAPAAVSTDGPAQLVTQQWARLWNSEAIEPLVALYEKDGEFFPTSGERIAGQQALRALFQAALAANKPVITLTSVSSSRSGNLAFDSGDYTEIITRKGNGTAFPVTGRYLVICRLGAGGHWLIVQQMWTEGVQKGR